MHPYRPALAACPVGPVSLQHWQRRLTWACPTGASSTSPSHCEYRPRPPPPWGLIPAACLCARPTGQPSHCPLGPNPLALSAPPWHPAAHLEVASLCSKPGTEGVLCLPARRPGEAWGSDGMVTGQRRKGHRGAGGTVISCLRFCTSANTVSAFSLSPLLSFFPPHPGLH